MKLTSTSPRRKTLALLTFAATTAGFVAWSHVASAQTDDDAPSPKAGKADPEAALEAVMGKIETRLDAMWNEIEMNGDDMLDGIELKRGGNWSGEDADKDGKVSKDEWMNGRARDAVKAMESARTEMVGAENYLKTVQAWRLTNPGPGKATPAKAAPVKAAPATSPATRPVAVRPPVAATRVAAVPPVKARAGHIVGRAVRPDGSPVPAFIVAYSGFEDGKLANTYMDGSLAETVNAEAKGAGGRYSIAVPKGAYRASAYVAYKFKGRQYYFDLEPLGPTPKYDYKGLQLEKLRGGLVRDFVLKMTGKKRDASENTETVYRYAYFGGTVKLDAQQTEGTYGGGSQLSKPLRDAFPADSKILLSLKPNGPAVDGTTLAPVDAELALGDDGKWTFMVRGIYPGTYTARANLRLPDGQIKPLLLSTKPSIHDYKNSRVIFDRQSSVTVDFLPDDVGPAPRKGVKAVTLYLGD